MSSEIWRRKVKYKYTMQHFIYAESSIYLVYSDILTIYVLKFEPVPPTTC